MNFLMTNLKLGCDPEAGNWMFGAAEKTKTGSYVQIVMVLSALESLGLLNQSSCNMLQLMVTSTLGRCYCHQ